MKSLSIVGIILLILSVLLFYLTTDFDVEQLKLSHLMGILGGVGIASAYLRQEKIQNSFIADPVDNFL